MLGLTRELSATLGACELTYLGRRPIDLPLARCQHACYRGALGRCGVEVIHLPAANDLPDAVFIEDTALVTRNAAILGTPGAASRIPEMPSIAMVLANYRPLFFLHPPAAFDGGDILLCGRTYYIGLSHRTNSAAAAQLRMLLQSWGYGAEVAPVNGCLHLKTAVTSLAPDVLLLNPAWIDPALFPGARIIETPPEEPWAVHRWRARLTGSAGFLQTRRAHPGSDPKWSDAPGCWVHRQSASSTRDP